MSVDGDVVARVLHPAPCGNRGSDNANSLVLAIEYSGRRILLPGDLESPGLDEVMATPLLDCDVIMAPHHGSTRSNPVGFAGWSRPEIVVISGGENRNALQVKEAYRTAGAQCFHTAEVGTVSVTIGRDGQCGVSTFRSPPNAALPQMILRAAPATPYLDPARIGE